MAVPHETTLRQAVLAAIVLHDLDAVPEDGGVLLRGSRLVPWTHVAHASIGFAAGSPAERAQIGRFLVQATAMAGWSDHEITVRLRPLGLPVGHALHPGAAWVRETVLGGSLDLGFGVLGAFADPDEISVLHPGMLAAFGLQPEPWWGRARTYLEEMGAVAATRLRRDPDGPLRPMGDCDVATLLASSVLRSAMVGSQGVRTAAVPMRRRGWLDLSRTDPAFALAAYAAADDDDRGFPRPLLLSIDEVVLAKAGGDVLKQVLREPVAPDPQPLTVPYR
jgi:hypothetical protein